MHNMKVILAAFIFTFTWLNFAKANHSEETAISISAEQAVNIIRVKVNGLVCAFCVRNIEKSFCKNEAVEAVDISLDDKIVTITLKEGKNLDDATITKIITGSGYNVAEIMRN
jgi:copper chaperone CopZ